MSLIDRVNAWGTDPKNEQLFPPQELNAIHHNLKAVVIDNPDNRIEQFSGKAAVASACLVLSALQGDTSSLAYKKLSSLRDAYEILTEIK